MTNPDRIKEASNNYEGGYRAAVSRTMINQIADHFSGKQRLDRNEDWFAGYQDAEDDLRWRAQGVEQMQFGL